MDIKKTLYRIYWLIQRVIVPSLRSSQELYKDVLDSYVNPGTKWLDLGCGRQILRSWLSEEESHLVENCEMITGIDYDIASLKEHKNISLKVRGDIGTLPFKSNSFDLVTANMVVEHLKNPDVQFQEVSRILKPGGIFIFHTPNVFGYSAIMGRLVPNILKSKLVHFLEERKGEDVFKTYYNANSRGRINNLVKIASFDAVKIKMVLTSGVFVFVPPLVVLELIWIRILMTSLFRPLRANIIAILRKRQ